MPSAASWFKSSVDDVVHHDVLAWVNPLADADVATRADQIRHGAHCLPTQMGHGAVGAQPPQSWSPWHSLLRGQNLRSTKSC